MAEDFEYNKYPEYETMETSNLENQENKPQDDLIGMINMASTDVDRYLETGDHIKYAESVLKIKRINQLDSKMSG